MGKSNKFDYTNRPNSGAKLGSIIGRDLNCQADKVQKEANKAAEKARKVSTGSTTSSSAASEATRDTLVHVLDIKIPGKKLGDDGACAMADGLESALRKGTYEASVALEDLNLSENGLTTVSLARLAPIIDLAKHDLKTLNLSNNAIMVESDEQAEQWESFLRAFKDCRKLRRLDLSGNINLGAKALEILAHVHIDEEAIVPMSVSGNASVYSLGDIETDDEETPRAPTFPTPLTGAGYIKRRCGLRSIPFLTLKEIGLTDAGALWLSYVIEDHYYPSQLIDELNATHAGSTIKTYQQGERGLDWDEHEPGFTRDGLYVLKKAEAIRQQTMLADQVTVASYDFADKRVDGENGEGGRKSIDRRHSRATRGDRRASIRSVNTNDGGDADLMELDSARKKLQRIIIEKHGVSSVELYQTGMKLAYAARLLRHLIPAKMYWDGPSKFDFTSSAPAKEARTSRPVTPLLNKANGQRSSSDGHLSTPNKGRKQGTYAATLTANTGAIAGEPELAITECTNSPTTPKMIFKPHRKEAFSDGGDLQTDVVVEKLDALILRVDSPQSYVTWQEKRIKEAGDKAFRDIDVPNHLPAKFMQMIAEYTVSERKKELLSEKQREKIVAWAEDPTSKEKRKEWRKMAESSQAWTLLESIGCLAYERE